MTTALAIWLYVWGGLYYASHLQDDASGWRLAFAAITWPVLMPAGLALNVFTSWRDGE